MQAFMPQIFPSLQPKKAPTPQQPQTLASQPGPDISGGSQQQAPMIPAPPSSGSQPQPAQQGGVAAPEIPPPGMLHVFTPAEEAVRNRPVVDEAIRRQAAQVQAQQQAEADRMKQVSQFNRQQNLDTIKDLQGQGVNHIHWQTDANGNMTVHPDMGKPIAGLVQGADFPEEHLDPNRFYRVKEFEDGKREFIPETGITQAKVMPDPGSSTGFSMVWFDRAGQEVSRKPGATPPPGLFPTSTSTTGVRMVPQPDGSIAAVPVTTQSTRTPQVPGMAPPIAPPSGTSAPGSAPRGTGVVPRAGAGPGPGPGPAGRVVGGRPLPEATKEKMDSQLQAIDNTMGLLQRVQQNSAVLNSLVSAGKIQLATSPEGVAQVISRGMPLNDKEAQMAADMQSLAEHINTLRGPLGATGFRGHEAFGALQSQRGQLLQNPKVTAAILNNTLTSLNQQKVAIQRSFQQHGLEVPPPVAPLEPPGGGGGGPVKISGDAEYNALAPGTTFIGPDGKTRRKP